MSQVGHIFGAFTVTNQTTVCKRKLCFLLGAFSLAHVPTRRVTVANVYEVYTPGCNFLVLHYQENDTGQWLCHITFSQSSATLTLTDMIIISESHSYFSTKSSYTNSKI